MTRRLRRLVRSTTDAGTREADERTVELSDEVRLASLDMQALCRIRRALMEALERGEESQP